MHVASAVAAAACGAVCAERAEVNATEPSEAAPAGGSSQAGTAELPDHTDDTSGLTAERKQIEVSSPTAIAYLSIRTHARVRSALSPPARAQRYSGLP